MPKSISIKDLVPQELAENEDIVRLTDIDGIDHPKSVHSVQEKLTAVTYWCVLGNMAEVERRTGISQNTIKYWKTTCDWWKEAVERIRLQRNEMLDASLTRAMDRLMVEIEDRIENGDEVLLKDGTSARQKIRGKDLTVMLGVIWDKRALMRGDPTSNPGGKNMSQQELLSSLKESFEDLSEKINRQANEKIVGEQ